MWCAQVRISTQNGIKSQIDSFREAVVLDFHVATCWTIFKFTNSQRMAFCLGVDQHPMGQNTLAVGLLWQLEIYVFQQPKISAYLYAHRNKNQKRKKKHMSVTAWAVLISRYLKNMFPQNFFFNWHLDRNALWASIFKCKNHCGPSKVHWIGF